MRRKTSISFLTIIGALLLSGCGGSESQKPKAPPKPVPVRAATAQTEMVPILLKAPGSVQPRDRVVLSSQINGFVREVRVHAGDLVAAGQTLATLDARDVDEQKAVAQASIEEAEAALEEARKGVRVAESMRTAARSSADLARGTYARYQKLSEARSISPQELDEVRAKGEAAAADLAAKEAMVAAAQDRLRQVEAKISQARAQSRRADVVVSWTVVKAPAAGRVSERSVDPGSAIFPGTPLLVLESTARPQVLASIPVTDSGRLRPGLEVEIRTPDSGPSGRGRVSEMIPVSAPGSHSIQFKVDLPPAFSAISGSFVDLAIPEGARSALLVPRSAIRENGQMTGLFVIDPSSTARFRLVKATPYDAGRLEVLAGLEPGERIIASPTDDITDGIPVEIRP